MIVKTNFDYPPIPQRDVDWSAWVHGREEDGPYGRGRTERAAVVELAVQMADEADTEGLIACQCKLLDLDIAEAERDGRNGSYIRGLQAARSCINGII